MHQRGSAHSQVSEASKVVVGGIEFPEPPKPANLWRDCPGYVIVRQQTVELMDTIKS